MMTLKDAQKHIQTFRMRATITRFAVSAILDKAIALADEVEATIRVFEPPPEEEPESRTTPAPPPPRSEPPEDPDLRRPYV